MDEKERNEQEVQSQQPTEQKEVKGKEEKRKPRTNVMPKRVLTEQEFKLLLTQKYRESNVNYHIIKEAVDNLTEKYKKQLVELIGFIDQALELKIEEGENGKKKYSMEYNLTIEELEFLAMKIPTACLFVQEQINDRALDASVAEYMMEDAITEHLKEVIGGDAKERQRFATQLAEMEQFVSLIKSQIYANLKTYIDRADKVYEGVKKVLDGKNREKGIFARDKYGA